MKAWIATAGIGGIAPWIVGANPDLVPVDDPLMKLLISVGGVIVTGIVAKTGAVARRAIAAYLRSSAQRELEDKDPSNDAAAKAKLAAADELDSEETRGTPAARK